MAAGVLETVARIVELGGAPSRSALVAAMRAKFESATGAYAPEDGWFEERSRAFWCDAVTRERFGRAVEDELSEAERAILAPLERAHRGLFRAHGSVVEDAWSGAHFALSVVDEASRSELDAAAGQLMDARVVGTEAPLVVALVPGAVFHSREATPAIEAVLAAARARALSTHEVLDALLRMERSFRALTRVKVGYAYRPDALIPPAPASAVRRPGKTVT